ncbi:MULTISPECIES: carbon-nitrogen hydrolase family protein [unclassified Mesorhizobium]|uniref:carbon-nitrogen hydrolase family protein n=1 Tax=unclassified Mesorhizobium TaxID=325217 RepID=UPI001127F6E8|nr:MULTISPECIES: carbon-nitrogen hydrolase family protein [unclassified Mesorhizobium]TPK95333.1 carbon-nitrogen hydrolase family protein [Mesorhizobium sp. B2-4-16]TPL61027.1 carbon-nitrogen hydrolase family protein [Mesorhizobium sp. B2-4-3]
MLIKACVVQAATVGSNTSATIDKAVSLILECGTRGAQLAVFPEAFIGGYPHGARFGCYLGGRTDKGRDEYAAYFESAINVPGKETAVLGEAAREAKMFVTIGVIERDGGTVYCTALFFGPDGSLLGKHRKLMPTALERLCWGFGDGSTLTTVDTPWGKMGAVICWENYMPMMRMAMYGQGIALYCAPTADDREVWTATMRHVALEGRCFVLSSCQFMTRANFPAGMHNHVDAEEGDVLMRGGSVIVDPLGRVLAGPDYSGETILTADLDMRQIARGKFDFDVVGHYARPDIFRLEIDTSPKQAVQAQKGGAMKQQQRFNG